MGNTNEVNLLDDELIKENVDKVEKSNYSILMNQWFSYQDNFILKIMLDFNKYRLLFSHSKGYLKIIEKKRIE